MRKIFRFDSSAVQGEGSFVVMRKPPWGALRKTMASGNAGEAEVALEMMGDLLPAVITAWNWQIEELALDGNGQPLLNDEGEQILLGKPLPLPKDDPSVIDELEMEEMMFLVEKVTGLISSGGPAKN